MNTKYIIDSRDIKDRIEELEDEITDLKEQYEDDEDLQEEDEYLLELEEELKELKGVYDEIGDEAQYGVTLIREDYFQEYAQEFAEDVGATNKECNWPYTCIDWEQAAEELAMDYSSIDINGVAYLYCG